LLQGLYGLLLLSGFCLRFSQLSFLLRHDRYRS
jgi:hypothetical protein